MSGDTFTRDKLAWVQQVVVDVELPLLARVLVPLIATTYLNRLSGDAWPAKETLARQLGRGVTQISEAIDALEARGHLDVTRRSGRTNLYRPIIGPPRISEGVADAEMPSVDTVTPSENRATPPRKTGRHPHGFPCTNPFEEPNNEPVDGAGPTGPTPDTVPSVVIVGVQKDRPASCPPPGPEGPGGQERDGSNEQELDDDTDWLFEPASASQSALADVQDAIRDLVDELEMDAEDLPETLLEMWDWSKSADPTSEDFNVAKAEIDRLRAASAVRPIEECSPHD